MSTLLEKLKQRKEAQAAKKAQNTSTAKLKDGKNIVRVLPNWAGDPNGNFYHDFGLHYVKAPGKQKADAVYMCMEKTYDGQCAVCDAIREGLGETKDDAVVKALKDSFATGRVLVNALIVNSENPETPVILEIPSTAFEQIVNTAVTYLEEDVDIFSVSEGHNFIIERTGKGMDTKYSVSPSPKPSAIDTGIISKLVDLEAFVKQESDSLQQKALTSVRKTIGLSSAVGLLGSAEFEEEELMTGTDNTPVASSTPKTRTTTQTVTQSEIVDAEFEEVSTPAASSSDGDIDSLLAELEDL